MALNRDDLEAGEAGPERPVNRCICRDVHFADLIRLHRETGADLEELRRRTTCGTGCGLCVPYIRVALRTGQAHLPVLSDAELERLGRGGP